MKGQNITSTKILCVFYGIGRGLEMSEPSIVNKMLKPLRRIGNYINSVYILNEIKKISNPRSGEHGYIPPVKEGVFNKCKIIRKSEEFLLDKELFELSKMYKDRYMDDFKSNKNLICQLSKLELASKSVDFNNYDKVILCRDDIVFVNETINWKNLLIVSDYGPVVSLWHWHGGIGERFVLCSPFAAKLICERKNLIKNVLNEYRTLHAELLQYYCLKAHKLIPHAFNLKLARCRINGRIHEEKYRIPIWRPLETLRIFLAFLRYVKRSSFINKKEKVVGDII